MRKYKNVMIHHNGIDYRLCHTIGGCLNPFADFKTEEAARAYAIRNGLSCRKELVTDKELGNHYL